MTIKYNAFLKTQMNGGQDTSSGAVSDPARVVKFGQDVIKCMLVTASYVPSANHAVKSSITNEVTGTNYPVGGIPLSNVTLTEMNGKFTFDADDLIFAGIASGFSNARYAIIYKDSGNANTSSLILGLDLVNGQTNTTGDLTIKFNDLGIANWN